MSAMEPVVFCPRCGVRAEGGKYCRSCGANLALISEAITGAQSQTGQIARGRARTLLGFFRSARLSNKHSHPDGRTTMALFGEVKIDLTSRPLPPGETRLSLYTIFGSTEIKVPEDVGVRVTGLTLLASVSLRRKEIIHGFVETDEYKSPGYEQATRRLHIDAVTALAELKIKQ